MIAILAVAAYFAYIGYFHASGPLAFLNPYSNGAMGAY